MDQAQTQINLRRFIAQDDEGAHSSEAIIIRERRAQLRLTVYTMHRAPAGLVVAEAFLIGAVDRGELPIADQVILPVRQHHIACGEAAWQLVRPDDRITHQRRRYAVAPV